MKQLVLRLLAGGRIRSLPALTSFVIVVFALGNIVLGHGLENALGGPVGGDFLAFYTGGSFARRGLSGQLLNIDAQHKFQEQVLGVTTSYTAVWIHPPYLAWLFSPFSRLPYLPAYALFVLLSGASFAFSLRALRRELKLEHSTPKLLWFSAQYFPTLHWLLNGQTTGIWLSVLSWVFIWLRRERDIAAGLLLGLFVCKPPLALGVAASLLGAKRFRCLAGVGVTTFALLGVGLYFSPGAMADYAGHAAMIASLNRGGGIPAAGLHGSFEFATLLLDGISHVAATCLGAALVLTLFTLLLVMWHRWGWSRGTRAWDLRMAATLAIGVVLSPHLFLYDLTLLVLPLCILMAWYPKRAPALPLDGDKLLASTAIVVVLGLVGPVLTAGMLKASVRCLGAPVAVQLGVVAIALWAFLVARAAEPEGAASRAD